MVQHKVTEDGRSVGSREDVHISEKKLHQIARMVCQDWANPYFGAVPYIQAMRDLTTLQDNYGLDSGATIVRYFLANSATWRGPFARQIKTELRRRLKEYDSGRKQTLNKSRL